MSEWFTDTFGSPSPPQRAGWPSIMRGENTLLLAPTGSGKTLAAFLWAINHLFENHLQEQFAPGVTVLYVSPLKALNNDIERNLQSPLTGILERARAEGFAIRPVRAAVRTGDTPQSKRERMLKDPPEILITTPESLYLMLTAKRPRPLFSSVRYVIIDEIHSICGNKRGVHLSLTLERLAEITAQDFVRIGLSATQRPLDLVARFLGGSRHTGNGLEPRPVTIVDTGRRKQMDLRVVSPVSDFTSLPGESVWPHLFEKLMELVLTHYNTLIFVNNRRLAERVASKLNDFLTGIETPTGLYSVPRKQRHQVNKQEPGSAVPVKAYHGSMSREARESMEAELKEGKLKALVATSALELGIDIGSIDLVVQIQSPKGVARGLQRIGRSGHLITATSKGRILPTYREDLVEAAVVARAMVSHEVEETTIPTNCLDVLAQQIVAIVSVEDRDVDELFDLVRRSYCYEHLSRNLFDGVIGMLSGRYERGALRELRARVSWDKRNNLLRALPGSAHLAISGGGTIADRGYYGIYLEDGKTKIGEIDEEFVFESRTGDTFILGTDTWRITAIDSSRLTVVQAPGEPARMPFWRGEGIGRTFELGNMVGRFRRELGNRLDDPGTLAWLQAELPVDHNAAWNILEYFRKQSTITRCIPSDRLIVVEGFRDEIGDPRIVVHSCFGRRVNGLLGLLFLRKLQDLIGTTPQMLYNDDGILFRCPDTDTIPVDFLDEHTLGNSMESVVEECLGSALFGGQFRQNASRALLMPRPSGGGRSPLWLQRLKAKDLLAVARQYEDFPIVIETVREVLHDILDLDHCREVVVAIEQGSIQVERIVTEIPSPFSASLLLDFISVYLYEWDEPKTDGAGKFHALNRTLLGEVLNTGESPLPLRDDAVADLDGQLQHTAPGFKARSPEELYEIMLRLGDLSDAEILERCEQDGPVFVQALAQDGRAVRARIGSHARWVASEIADEFDGEPGPHRNKLIRRMVMNHAVVTPEQIGLRYDLPPGVVRSELEKMGTDEDFTMLPCPDETIGQRWASVSNLQKMQRKTIAFLRREIRPSTLQVFTQFLFRWQHVDPETRFGPGADLGHCIHQLQGFPVPVEALERDILRSRATSYERDSVSRLTSSGSVIWTGLEQGKLIALIRGEGNAFLPASHDGTDLTASGFRILEYLKENGASFFSDIRSATGLPLASLNRGLADLLWNGMLTNDVFDEVLKVRKYQNMESSRDLERIELTTPRHNPRRADALRSVRTALRNTPGWNGRWSLVRTSAVLGDQLPSDQRAGAQARQLLERYGIVARELVRRETFLPWSLLAIELQRMELRGEIRRGYFVEGLSGMQFAHPDAVEMLRMAIDPHRDLTLLLNASDPANPLCKGVPIPEGFPDEAKISKGAQNYAGFSNGRLALIMENYGTRLWIAAGVRESVVRDCLHQLLNTGVKEVRVQYLNGERPAGTTWEKVLRSCGFYRDRDQTMRLSRFT